jgi:membrane dipeptidase
MPAQPGRRRFHPGSARLGGHRQRQFTNTQNLLGSGSAERVDAGITDYGIDIIKAMNEVGMLIDVSHSGDRTTLDAIELSPRPVAVTHSNCRALNNHPRKIYDLTDSLVRRGYSDVNIQAVLGGNFRRLLGDAWVAQPHPTQEQS